MVKRNKRRYGLTIDVAPLLDDQWTGIPVFTKRLISALLRHDKFAVEFSCGHAVLSAESVKTAMIESNGAALHEYLGTQLQGRRTGYRSDQPLLFPSVKRTFGMVDREASTVHDLSTLLMPETHLDENVRHHLQYMTEEFRTDEVIFCASEATRAALKTALPSTSSKTRVLYQYVDWPENFQVFDDNLMRPKLGQYAIVVGTIEPRKNLSLIFNSLNTAQIARSNLKFVVVGRAGWKTERLLNDVSPEQRERLVFTGYVSEFVKYRLIRHSEFLIYPSLYEGFGIPALEAMSLGKPVLAARTSSFPEIIGGAGIFFDPLSVSEFAEAFEDMRMPKRLATLSREAIKQSSKFDWRRMAAPILEWVRS